MGSTPAPAVDADSRGSTSIPATVVARIAEQAASELPQIGSAAGGVLGVGARRDFATRPSAECDLYGSSAVLRMDVGMTFPVAIAPTARSLREHVTSRVQDLTGLEVGRMDVEISWLNVDAPGRSALR